MSHTIPVLRHGLSAFVLTCGFAIPFQFAQADPTGAWLKASPADLATQRGGVAFNLASQEVGDQISSGNLESGGINLSASAVDGQRMVINAFNTGNHVVMQNQLAVEVNIY